MQGVKLKPEKKQIVFLAAEMLGLAVIAGLVPSPAAVYLCAAFLPLCLGPFAGKNADWFALGICMAFAAMAAPYGWEGALGVVVMTVLPFLAFSKKAGQDSVRGWLMVFCCESAGILLCLSALTDGLRFSLPEMIAGRVTEIISASPDQPRILAMLGENGLLRFPRESVGMTLEALSHEPALLEQMRLSLTPSLLELVQEELPGILTAIVLGVPLFTVLRVNRYSGSLLVVTKEENGKKQAVILVPTGFRILKIPRKALPVLLGVVSAGGLLLTGSNVFCNNLGRVLVASFCFLWEMQGAAVIVYRLEPRPNKRAVVPGILAVLLYLMIPPVLLILGLEDSLFTLRKLPEQGQQ